MVFNLSTNLLVYLQLQVNELQPNQPIIVKSKDFFKPHRSFIESSFQNKIAQCNAKIAFFSN